MRRSWIIDRRTLLRAGGIAIALPLLDIMGTVAAADPEAAEPAPLRFRPPKHPVRLMMLNLPCGTIRAEWGVEKPGPIAALRPLLAPLQPHAQQVTILGNLWNQASKAHKITHLGPEVNLWTCTPIKATTGADLNVGGVSVDQVAARSLAAVTRIPSLNLGTMPPPGGVLQEFSRVYLGHLSWRSPTLPVQNDISPRRVFDKLFRNVAGGAGSRGGGRVVVETPAQEKESVLDYVLDEVRALRARGSSADQKKLEEYTTAVRDIEQQMRREEREAAKQRRMDPAAARAIAQFAPQVEKDPVEDRTKLVRMMLDLAVLALWTDSTRVATMMFANERMDTSYSFISGVTHTHHEASHWAQSPDRGDSYRKINRWFSEQVAYLLERMGQIKEPNGGSLLDNSLVFWASALSDGNTHRTDNLPVLLAGRGGGLVKSGRHVVMPAKTPLANLYLTLLQNLGVAAESFADSTGVVKELYA